MFHATRGCNVVLNKPQTEAAWKPRLTGGVAFTDRPLAPSDTVTITFTGSGAAELGLTTLNPASPGTTLHEDTDKLPDYTFLNDIKLHRRTCTMKISLNETAKV